MSTLLVQDTNQVRRITPEAKKRLMGYEWNGNIRELRNMIERALILEPGIELTAQYLGPQARQADHEIEIDLKGIDLEKRVDRLKQGYIRKALKMMGGDISKAARLLKISRRKLEYYLKK